MRAEEILSRTWKHIDLKNGVIRLLPGETKNDEGRIVPMAGPALEILKAQRAANPDAEYVFTRNGKPIKDFRKAWCTALEKAGLVAGRRGHTFHGTRRGVATNLMRARVDVKTAMAITGHKDDKIFRRYQQVAESDVKAAAKRLEAYLTGQVVEISGQVSGQVRTQRKARVRK
jgi:integrase